MLDTDLGRASRIPKKTGSVTFTVGNMTRGSLGYESASNHYPDGDSTGSNIRVIKP